MFVPRCACALAVLSFYGCAPGDFDKLKPSGATDPSDAQVAALDGAALDARVPSIDAATPLPDSDLPPDDQPPSDDDPPTGDAGTCLASATGELVVSKGALELARMAASPLFSLRVLGPTTRLGTTDHVWTFSSVIRAAGVAAPAATPSNLPFAAFDGDVQPWNRPVLKPWSLQTNATGDNLPRTLLPLRSGEPASTQLVPSSLYRRSGATVTDLYVLQYDGATPSQVWLASLDDSADQAQREPQPLFSKPPLFAISARIDDTDLHVYACSSATSQCVVGRVAIDQRYDPSAYQVRTLVAGKWTWTSDLQAGTPVLENVNQNDLTVSYNSYLRRFLAVHGEPSSNQVALRTARSPYGPWSEPVRVALPAPASLNNVGIREHPALAQNCERRIIVSYVSPTAASNGVATAGDVVMTAIDFD